MMKKPPRKIVPMIGQKEVPAKPMANTAAAPTKYAKIRMNIGGRIFRSMNCVQNTLPKIPDRLKMIVPIIAS